MNVLSDTMPTIHIRPATAMQVEVIARITFIRLERMARIIVCLERNILEAAMVLASCLLCSVFGECLLDLDTNIALVKRLHDAPDRSCQ